MGPEATFIEGLASGRIGFGAGLLAILVWIVWKGGAKLDKLTAAVEAVPPALALHKVDNDARAVTLTAHVTSEASRVIKVIEDRRLSEVEGALEDVKRQASNPDVRELSPRATSGTRRAGQ